jgi:hypothetical protein
MFVKKCGAKARTNNHQPCRQPAMANGRCRLHGGKSSGAKTKEGKQKQKKANRKHGFYTPEVQEELKFMRFLRQKAKENLKDVK